MTYATVRAATNDELTLLRSAGQWSKLYLAIFKPSVIYKARLSVVPSTTDRVVQITFASGVGTLANVRPDMSVYVGTTDEAYDLGIARIRKAPIAGTFYISEESDINWNAVVSGGIYLTVVNEFDVWAKHINTVSDTEFYMDYDVAYTDQNVNFDPIPVMGGHRAVRLVAATVGTVWDFTNSYVIGSSISSYLTECPTASAITGAATATPTVTFDTPGWHAVYLTVTAATGKTFWGVRYVYVYDDDNMPLTVFQLDNCSVDYEVGGWSFEVTMQDQIDIGSVPDRALCILFTEDYYNGTKQSIGQLVGCENIVCVGKISEESYVIDPELSEATLRIHGMHHWMQRTYAFPTGLLQSTTTPPDWVRVQDLTTAKALHHLLHWGSTVTRVMDVYLPTADTRLALELVGASSNIWAQMLELAFASIQARPGVDKYGRLFVEIEPQLIPLSSRTWATVMTLTSKDWRPPVAMQRVVVSPTGMVNLSGVYIASDNSGGAIFSLSPGHVFKHYGTPEVVDRLLLATQGLSNQMAALFLGWRNNPFPNSEMQMSSNNRMIDCFPRQRLYWSLASGANPREISFATYFIPRRVELSWDGQFGVLETSLSLEMESVEDISVDGDIPGGAEDLSEPPAPPAFPKLPDFVVVLPTEVEVEGPPSVVVLHDVNGGICVCENFESSSPVWILANAGLTSGEYQSINNMFIAPNGSVYVLKVSGYSAGQHFLYRAPSLTGTYVAQTYPNALVGFAGNPNVSEQVALLTNSVHGGTAVFRLGANNSFTAPGVSFVDAFQDTAYKLSYGNNYWLHTQYNSWRRINIGGTSVTLSGNDAAVPAHLRCGKSSKIISERNALASLLIGNLDMTDIDYVDNSVNLIDISIAASGLLYAASDSTGTYLMSRGLGANKARSADGGYSWSPIPNLPAGNWFFAYAGGVGVRSKWIAVSGTQIKYSEDFGNVWEDKLGNLATVTPATPNPNMIRVPGVI